MKFYTCVTERSLGAYVDHLRVAINSAREIAKLDPHILYDGAPEVLVAAIGHGHFTVHTCESALIPEIRSTPEREGWSRMAAEGALLRLEIPRIERESRYVLYADCDVVFTRRCDLNDWRPEYLAAAPGANPREWRDICSGVMLMNVDAWREEYNELLAVVKENMGTPHFYDQEAINIQFRGRIERLPLEYHWKAYWYPNPLARIVHFHGPKRQQIEMLRSGQNAELLKSWYQFLFMQQEGLDYYAALFDDMAERKIRSAYDIMRSRPREFVRFFVKKLEGSIRRFEKTFVSAEFDEEYYHAANPDVAIAVHLGWIPSAAWHFARMGAAQGRLPCAPPR